MGIRTFLKKFLYRERYYKSKRHRLPSLGLIPVVLFVIFVAAYILPIFGARVMEEKEIMTREMVGVGLKVLGHYRAMEEEGQIEQEEAQRQAIEAVKAMTFGDKEQDYYWINDLHPRMIMHPFRPDLEGEDLTDFEDPEGLNLFVGFVHTVKEHGSGFVTYKWQYYDDTQRLEPKLSYVAHFEPWDWILGSGVYINDIDETIAATRNSLLLWVLVVAAITGAVFLLKERLLWDAEKNLRESEERLNTLLSNTPAVIYSYNVIDGMPRINYVNENVKDVLGFEPEDFINNHNFFVECLHPEDAHKFFAAIPKVMADGRATLEEYRFNDKEGNYHWLHDKQQLINQGDGTPEVIGAWWDITERKQAEENLNYRFQFEKLVSEISSRFISISSDKIDEEINYVLQQTGEFFNVDRSYVFQFSANEKNRSNTHEWCAEGIESQMDKLQKQPLESMPFWAEQLRNRDYIHIPDVNKLPPEAEAERKEFQRQGIQSLLTVSIQSKGRTIGFFGFDSVKEKKSWPEETISFLQIIADILASAFEKSIAEEKIRYMSFHDSLTDLYNRRYIEEEMKRLDTERQLPISIVMVDINGLKLVNDTYGHEKGDEMLKRTAEILKKSCREEEMVARWGGDEFVILFPKTTAYETNKVCVRIMRNCKKAYVNEIPVSIALGFACKESSGKDLSQVLSEAEDSMYQHKLTEDRSAKNAVLKAFLKTLAEKSFETEEHVLNMQRIAQAIGQKLDLPDSELNRLELIITLHDIGKINITEEVLTKEGPLTQEEWEIIKRHPEIGFRIAGATEEFAHVAEDILAHHERWDGSGYPRGLKGEDIPLLARITAIADAYEVMRYGRPYKESMSKAEIEAELKKCSGSQFDPELVAIFLSILAEGEID